MPGCTKFNRSTATTNRLDRQLEMRSGTPRILVIRRRYLGDLILLGAILKNLRLQSPGAHIAVITEQAYAGVLAMNPEVDEVLPFPHGLAGWWSLIRRLWRKKFSTVYDFDNRDKTALVAWLSRAEQRFALHHGEKVHLGWMYTDHEVVSHSLANLHLIDFHNRLLTRAGIPIVGRDISLQPREADLQYIRALPELISIPDDRPRLIVHPGSRSACRIWPAKNFAAVLDEIQGSGLASVTLVSGPAEKALTDEIQRLMKTPVADLNQGFSLPQLGALLSTFDLLLCHDSGPMHLAAAVGTPVVALYGSQDRVLFAPVGAGHICLSPPLPCLHCVLPNRCTPGDSYNTYCVRNIRESDVVTAVTAQLKAGRLKAVL